MGQDVTTDSPTETPATTGTLRTWLALNASTGALLGAILLVGMGSELWAPLIPEYLHGLNATIMAIALYGCFKDFLDAIGFYVGGTLAARFNTRRALLLFNALPLVGLVILLIWPNMYAVFVALPFVGIWNSIAGPATLRVVGDTLSTRRRSMAFSLQSIQKRLSSILAYFISGAFVVGLGELMGVRAGVALSIVLVSLSLLLQYRFMRTAVVDHVLTLHKPWTLLGQFDPQLRRLLVSDILARWCEGLARDFLILYCVVSLVQAHEWSPGQTQMIVQSTAATVVAPAGVPMGSFMQTAIAVKVSETDPLTLGWRAEAAAFYVGVLLTVMNVTSLVLYLPIGHLASLEGAAKKPFIGLTFIFFALFPLSLVILGPAWGMWGLVLGFIIGGLREIGEPARKAMVTELAPHAFRTQAIGIYWTLRSVGVMSAPLVGGSLWLLAGPRALLVTASVVGIVGACWFYLKFAGASAGMKNEDHRS